MQVSENTIVAIRFKMINSKGEVLENIMEGQAINYLHGSGSILPALEAELSGLETGDSKKIFISKDQGYEETDDDFIVEVIIDQIRPATEKEIIQGGAIIGGGDEHCETGCIC